MNSFQVIVIILSALGLLGGIIAVHVKSQIDIAKIQVQIKVLDKDSDRKEIALLNLEKRNHEEHTEINCKLDQLIKSIKT
jgi:hypothetical protein